MDIGRVSWGRFFLGVCGGWEGGLMYLPTFLHSLGYLELPDFKTYAIMLAPPQTFPMVGFAHFFESFPFGACA